MKTTNEAGQTKATVLSYDTADLYNNVWKVSERDFTTDGSVSATELRRTETTYLNQSSYLNRGLIHLPTSVKVFAGGATQPTARTDYFYDEATPTSYSDIGTMMYSDPGTSARANLTRIRNYPDVTNLANYIDHTTGYDVAGNVLTAQVDCCQQKSISYSSSYFYAYATSVTSGGGPTLTTSAAYDSHTGLTANATDENGQVTNFYYNSSSLRPAYVQRADGSTTHFYYGDGLQGNSSTNGLHQHLNATRLKPHDRQLPVL